MCGIAGMIDPALGRDDATTLLGGMLDSIRHRGPDASGTWVDMPVLLGHDRLSIIDLSDLGGQPMEYEGLVIVHNGEVYNYLEIRAELEAKGHRFRSTSDTEVIVAAYKEWGAECVSRFVGMWAFAIWDKDNRELFCSRDRFGIKPLYYIHSGDRFYFGSQYAPLKRSPLFEFELNLDHVRRGFQVGAIAYRDETYYRCLKALPERSNLLFKDGTVTVEPYWELDCTRRFPGSFEDKRQRFLELFRDSVRLHMRSDVPIGGMLSGGMDSSAIASVVGTDFPDVDYKTFTVYYDGWKKMDERRWAKEVVAAYPNLDPFYFQPDDDEIADSYESIVDAFEAPLPATPPISCWFVMKAAAANGLKVMLDGQGSDEFIGGYHPAYDRQIAGLLRRMRFLTAARALLGFRRERSADLRSTLRVAATGALATVAGEQALWMRHFRPTISEMLTNDVPYSLERVPGSRLSQYFYHLLFASFLPSLLHYGDRMSMAWSVECRVPFLDHRLVEFVFSLDDDDKLHEGQSKYIQRRALEGLLPNPIIHRKDKQPFLGGEASEWLRGPLRHLTEMPLDLDGLGFLGTDKANALVQEFKSGNDGLGELVFSIVNLNYWLARQ